MTDGKKYFLALHCCLQQGPAVLHTAGDPVRVVRAKLDVVSHASVLFPECLLGWYAPVHFQAERRWSRMRLTFTLFLTWAKIVGPPSLCCAPISS